MSVRQERVPSTPVFHISISTPLDFSSGSINPLLRCLITAASYREHYSIYSPECSIATIGSRRFYNHMLCVLFFFLYAFINLGRPLTLLSVTTINTTGTLHYSWRNQLTCSFFSYSLVFNIQCIVTKYFFLLICNLLQPYYLIIQINSTSRHTDVIFPTRLQ
jgi:hypothetical protein